MALEFKDGKWPTLSPRKLAEGDSRLKLSGVTIGKTPLAVINGKTFSEGESSIVALKEGPLKVKCVQIKQDAVLISIDGESESRWLTLK